MTNKLINSCTGKALLCPYFILLLFASLVFGGTDTTKAIVDTTKVEVKQIAPPTFVSASDVKYDGGGSIIVRWRKSTDDNKVISYHILRSTNKNDGFVLIDSVVAGTEEYVDSKRIDNEKDYFYKVSASDGKTTVESEVTPPVQARASLFNLRRVNAFIAIIFFTALILWFIRQARLGKEIFLRRIAGLDAITEAVGRATEMGKPVLYVPGINDMDDIQTIASMIILGKITEIIAEYETSLVVPVKAPFVVQVAEETVKQGFMNAGKPDAYKSDTVRFITDSQFAYTAGVNGIMMREKPAANLYLGAFYAESLILAETGFSAGSIQVAGTANVHQIPFFVVACDYALIGEELYVASAYLSREPRLLGTTKASDIIKVIIIIFIIFGTISEMFGVHYILNLFGT